MSQQRTKRHLSIQESADYWDVSSMTIRRRIADGSLPALRVGHRIRIRVEDLENLARPIPAVRRSA